ncbi:MAG: LptE family protein [Cytophagales bacterium]|nr:LptE family protein [Cytophagales bacterium]
MTKIKVKRQVDFQLRGEEFPHRIFSPTRLSQQICLISLALTSCGVYSFTGAALPAQVKTISVQNFYNNAPLGPGDVGNTFAEALREYFLNNSSLVLVNEGADLEIEGTIEDFTFTAVAPRSSGHPQGIDFASLSRLSITIQVSYRNLHDDRFNFDRRNFSFFKDFDPNTEDYTSQEQRFIREITDQIILDVFNATIANW